ncbi:LolE-like permease protein [hydrothermal vent metagenome]|uniref:LolE-like permease protein n=1 Tax=hydrothermal vent metagenome TaxID=652676 RepID=A0A3B0Z705_9ZZZZ
MKWLKLAIKNLLRNRRRAFVTVLITAVGVSAILIGGGFANFTYLSLKEMAARSSGHLIVAHPNYFDKEENTPMEFGLQGYQALAKTLKSDPDVRYAIARINFSGLISNGEKSTIFMGAGVDAKYEFKVKGPFLDVGSGSVLSKREREDDPKIMLGVDLAKSLSAKVNDSLTLMSTTVDGGLNAMDVTVQGIFSTGMPEVDKRSIIVNINTAQSLLVTDKVSSIALHLRETEATFKKYDQFTAQYPELAWETWLDQAFLYKGVKNLYNRIFGLLGFIIVMMVFFSIYNTVNMSVVERTREIGTLRAIGTYTHEITRNFVLEGMVIGVVGATIGITFAALASLGLSLAEIQMPPPPGQTNGYPLFIAIPANLYLIAAAMSLFICTLAAWLSSSKAAKKPIVGALSHV